MLYEAANYDQNYSVGTGLVSVSQEVRSYYTTVL